MPRTSISTVWLKILFSAIPGQFSAGTPFSTVSLHKHGNYSTNLIEIVDIHLDGIGHGGQNANAVASRGKRLCPPSARRHPVSRPGAVAVTGDPAGPNRLGFAMTDDATRTGLGARSKGRPSVTAGRVLDDERGFSLEDIGNALRGIRFGEVRVVVQDGVVVQIDRVEKQRVR